jgi:hypothetical protein
VSMRGETDGWGMPSHIPSFASPRNEGKGRKERKRRLAEGNP